MVFFLRRSRKPPIDLRGLWGRKPVPLCETLLCVFNSNPPAPEDFAVYGRRDHSINKNRPFFFKMTPRPPEAYAVYGGTARSMCKNWPFSFKLTPPPGILTHPRMLSGVWSQWLISLRGLKILHYKLIRSPYQTCAEMLSLLRTPTEQLKNTSKHKISMVKTAR